MPNNGAPFKRVHSGERLAVPASTFNAMIDAAEAHKATALGTSVGARNDRRAGDILVQNNSGADVQAGGVLGIDGVLVDYDDNESEFRYQPSFDGAKPQAEKHTGKYVITAGPIADGDIGPAYHAGGICAVKIEMVNAHHLHADVTHDDASKLTSSPRGSARILWKEDGTGEKWALVSLSSQGVLAPQQIAKRFTASGTFTTPDHITQMTAIVVGGGGGGGGGQSAWYSIALGSGDGSMQVGPAGGGGGGGGKSAVLKFIAPPATDFDVVIGAGGAGGAVESSGSDGGETTVDVEYYNDWPEHLTPSLTLNTLSAYGGGGGGGANSFGNKRCGQGGTGGITGTSQAPAGESGAHFYDGHEGSGQGEDGRHGMPGAIGSTTAGLGGKGGHPLAAHHGYGVGGSGAQGLGTGSSGVGGYVMFIW